MSLAEKYLTTLNEDQTFLVQSIMTDLNEINHSYAPKCRAYFLEGPGGTGKTWCYNTLISWCRGKGVNVASSAYTGIAATLLKGGYNLSQFVQIACANPRYQYL